MEYGMHRRQFNLFRPLMGLVAVIFTLFLAQPVAADEEDPKYVLALGDSLTAGYQLNPEEAFPAQLQAYLQNDGLSVQVINAGVSGNTSGEGLARLGWALGDIPGGVPDLAIIELGANDAMRGVSPDKVRQNLSAIIEQLQALGSKVLLAGMLAPPNMGPAYAAEFDPIYAELSAKYSVPRYPFFLDGVATVTDLVLPDGKHPTGEGVAVIVTRIAPLVKTLLAE